jgi:tetratricopeptide (TPR) repeat protein
MNIYGNGTETRLPAAYEVNLPQRSAPILAGAWPFALLLLLATLPYVGVLRNDFAYAYDDKAQIIDNPYVHAIGHLRETLTTNVWSHKATQGVPSYYRPMMTIGFLLCYQVFGPMAYGFHLASLLLHAAIVVILFLFAERVFRDRGAAFGTAALFALHPIHIESVAWISAVTDLEVTFFYLLTFWCYLRVGEQRSGRHWAQAAMAVSFLLTIFSKEQAMTLPLLAATYEHFYRSDRAETTWAQKVFRYGPLWVLSLVYVPMRIWFLGSFASGVRIHSLTVYQTLLSALALLGQYFSKLLWPARLSAFYVFQASARLFDTRVLAGIGALVFCAAAFVALWKRARPASFGILWFLVTLAPVLNARWMTAYVFAERYLYLPSVGFCLVAGWACAALWRTASKRQTLWRIAAVAAACVVTGLCVLRIVTRIPDWRDDLTLLTRTMAVNPNEYALRDDLGQAYWMRGEPEAAEREWREALRLDPSNPQIPFELGAIYANQRRFDEAVALFERSIRLAPGQPDAHLNLGAAYAEMGKLDRAEEQFRAAIALTPLNFNAHNVLGKLYFDAGRLNEAEEQFRQSLACEPNLAAYDHLGYIYMHWGDQGRAETAFKGALTMKGTDSHAHFNLGLIYEATGRDAQARDELQAALAADPNNPSILSALEKLRR